MYDAAAYANDTLILVLVVSEPREGHRSLAVGKYSRLRDWHIQRQEDVRV